MTTYLKLVLKSHKSSFFNLVSDEITGMNHDAQVMVGTVHCLVFKANGNKKESKQIQ